MKRHALKKAASHKAHPRRDKRSNTPLEFGRGWQELEAQADRLKSDWMSLAAQLGISSRGRPTEESY